MDYWSKVDSKGYKILKKIVSNDDIFTIRKNLDNFFSKNPAQRMLNLEDSIKGVGLIENLQLNKSLLSSLSDLFPDENWSFVNDFQVLKNMASLSKGGWHADCNSQYSMPSLNKDMSLKHYKFLKIGFYFQGNKCNFGSSIEVIPYSYLLPKWGYKVLTFLLNKTIFGESLAKLLSKKLDKSIEPGDCILFDCRLIHRSSPAREDHVDFSTYDKNKGAFKVHIPNENKYAFYFEAGDYDSCMQFLRSNTMRIKDDSEGFFIEYLTKSKHYFFNIFSKKYRKELQNKIAYLEEEDLKKIGIR
tara:strand:+ start:614 stop:1516 length:903 start_codon:yes stop_codon:yes gene_type:complete